jgi:diaminopimelate epimerase
MGLRFTKMHGIGNDFAVVDARRMPFALDGGAIRRFADRHFGAGFDQLLAIEPAHAPGCAFAYRIWNADGTPARQCGNGLRCIVAWLAREGALAPGPVHLESPAGPVAAELLADGRVEAGMGEPRFAPADIPLRAEGERDAYAIDAAGHAVEVGAVSLGNPHAVLEVDDLAQAPVAVLGPQVEHAPAFPHRCNVGFAQVLARDAIALRVWERGVGETLACGSGACAAVAVLRRRGKLDADVRVHLPGGALDIGWLGPGHAMRMRGPAAFVYEGEWIG